MPILYLKKTLEKDLKFFLTKIKPKLKVENLSTIKRSVDTNLTILFKISIISISPVLTRKSVVITNSLVIVNINDYVFFFIIA
jgi:hypothetical protein